MRLAFALVPKLANLPEDEDCADHRKANDNVWMKCHLLCLQLPQMMGMLPAWARIRAAAEDFFLFGIAAAVHLAGCLVIAARAVAGAASQHEECHNGDQSLHGLKSTLLF